jgi:hypothetical protein
VTWTCDVDVNVVVDGSAAPWASLAPGASRGRGSG